MIILGEMCSGVCSTQWRICSETQGMDMKFGLFQSVQLPEPGAQAKYYKEALEQVLRAEQLGFDSVWLTEHHFSRHGIVPASLTVLAYLAGMTTTLILVANSSTSLSISDMSSFII